MINSYSTIYIIYDLNLLENGAELIVEFVESEKDLPAAILPHGLGNASELTPVR